MNTVRIAELHTQAVEYENKKSDLGDCVVRDPRDTFALLIIGDCLEAISKNFVGSIHSEATHRNIAIQQCKDSIKEHFGVK